ncbi:MAG: hypothetical protein NTY38_23180, partial [Acidobacteria bacterium]|nr:hypothetical protein [Acidobacteriota bacterium]
NYEGAIPLLRADLASNPTDEQAAAALLSALAFSNAFQDAKSFHQDLAARFPDSPAILTATADFAYYTGRIPAAEALYRAALKMEDRTPRAYYGFFRVLRAASFYRQARLLILRAHDLDPNGAAITADWLSYLPRAERPGAWKSFCDRMPAVNPSLRARVEARLAIEGALGDRQSNRLERAPSPAKLELTFVRRIGLARLGYALRCQINGVSLKLMVDTHSSGIRIDRRQFTRAGILPITQVPLSGAKPDRQGTAGLADSCAIGPI